MTKEKLIQSHKAKFNVTPEIVAFAPGRVNFIGEHTDYNGGLVMPLALEMGIYAAASRNDKGLLRIHSLDFNKYGEFDIKALSPDARETWANCPKGMVQMLMDAGHKVAGFDLTMTGNLPMGAGLSSSAAAEVAAGFAAKELFGFRVEGVRLALLAQKAEHEFTGAKCGIMDMAISILGKKETLLKLSCRDLSYQHIPFKLKSLKLLIVNTGVKHNLAQGEYNVRRKECAEGFNIATKIKPGIETLSDFTLDLLEENKIRFPEPLHRRCYHVLSENARVASVGAHLAKKEFAEVGRLMTESHQSLRKDYQVSCGELDWLVDHAIAQRGVLGARMTGGGFGGCAIVLLEEKAEEDYRKSLEEYKKAFRIAAQVFEAVPSDGARVILARAAAFR